MRPDSSKPIGVFDSGVGGLTVLKSLLEKLPEESTLYLGDTARVPYGTKSADVVTRYSLRNGEFLLRRGVKLIVVACNTASSVALQAMAEHLRIPIVGVIEPGARAAAERSPSGRIGVIGTPGTILSGAYQRALLLARPGAVVTTRPCPLFVPLAEEGWTRGEVPRLVAREYLGGLRDDGIDTLVLGCTHYPLLREVIAEALGEGVQLVDSADATAEAVAATLAAEGLRNPGGAQPSHAYFVTDVPERFREVGARFLGRPIGSAEQVDI